MTHALAERRDIVVAVNTDSASPPENVVRASECAESPYANGPYTLRGSELGSGVARQPRGGGCIDRSGGLTSVAAAVTPAAPPSALLHLLGKLEQPDKSVRGRADHDGRR